jgi:hypothetical protein
MTFYPDDMTRTTTQLLLSRAVGADAPPVRERSAPT